MKLFYRRSNYLLLTKNRCNWHRQH